MSVVLDASAVLALVQNEPGAMEVASVLGDARISSVNVAEVSAKLALGGVSETGIRNVLAGLGLVVEVLDGEAAIRSGLLAPATRPAGLSLGDRACLALAMASGVPAYTADQAWTSLALPVQVVAIR